MFALFSMAKVAKILDLNEVAFWRLVYRDHMLPAPTTQKGKRLYYTAEQIEGFKKLKAKYDADMKLSNTKRK